MPTKSVKWFSGGKPAEIYQSFNMKFSFANEKDGVITQCHQWVKCRDFLHDAVRTALTGTPSSIWSFTFDKGKNPELCLEGIKFLVSKKDVTKEGQFKPVLTKALKLIHHMENLAGVELSKITKVEPDKAAGYKHVWYISGPKFWLTAPYLVSLYTLLLRLGNKDISFKNSKELHAEFEKLSKGAPGNDNDLKYLKSIWDKIEKVVMAHEELAKPGKDGFSELYRQGTPIGSFHDNTGIVSACSANTWSKEFNKRINKVLKEKN